MGLVDLKTLQDFTYLCVLVDENGLSHYLNDRLVRHSAVHIEILLMQDPNDPIYVILIHEEP